MTNGRVNDSATSNMVAWSSRGAHMRHEAEDEVPAEADEPPDGRASSSAQGQFQRTKVLKPRDPTHSLLTKALHQPEEEAVPVGFSTATTRRRSMNSNISLASTADLTSDTGLTSPARTNTPSPPAPVIRLGRLNTELFNKGPRPAVELATKVPQETGPTKGTPEASNSDSRPKNSTVEALTKKRCISFACGAKPEAKKPAPLTQTAQSSQQPRATVSDPQPPRKTSIKFACPSKPRTEDSKTSVPEIVKVATKEKGGPSSAMRKHRSPSAVRSQRSLTPRRYSRSPVAVRSKKYLAANTVDLNSESSRFHEFASDEPQEEDWIRQNLLTPGRRLTINDTLQKENEIRRLGKEAEEEAQQEEEEQDEPEDEDEDADEDDNEDEDAGDDEDEDEDELEDELEEEYDIDDDFSGYGSDDDASDGYNTDNEGGFADSDKEEDGDNLELWTYSQAPLLQLTGATPINRRPSIAENRSDSSASSIISKSHRHSREKSRRIKIRPGTPELPDSTDFVCGTLDEDRPMEDAYISCIAQRRRDKLHLIPQDIDPSFPTSEPEDEDEGEKSHKPAHDSDDQVWIHGELEDLHHGQDRNGRGKKKTEHSSPKRYHSPPPKRHHSPPPPKARGRSPRKPADRHSPRRLVSPPPSGRAARAPLALPAQTSTHFEYRKLAFRSGQNQTKSLPRAPAMFPTHLKGQRRRQAALNGIRGHVRGAIDIVKGLEHKRQRRKEKYIQKHCNRARKGQIAEKRPQPGLGAERMRELGLLRAGKQPDRHPDRYVLSI